MAQLTADLLELLIANARHDSFESQRTTDKTGNYVRLVRDDR